MRRLLADRALAVTAVAAMALGGCTHFEAAGERPPTSAPAGAPGPAGGGTSSPSSTRSPAPAATASSETAPTAPTTTAIAAVAAPASPRNVASAVTEGLEVEVLAEGGPDYPSAPRFRIQVTLRNRSDRTRHHLLGQGSYAVLVDHSDQVVWASGGCNPTLEAYEIHGGAAPLGPGEEIAAIVDYPQPDVRNDAGCDLPDGRYRLFGLFPVCPPERVRETANPGTYACPEDSVEMYSSSGLAITIGDPDR